MCVDFKNLNKACPKDGYPLPEIDWKVESLCGFPFKCFLNAYTGYHQIQMAKEDEEKTAFIISQGIFCYTKMPFGLWNVGVTEEEIVRDIEETFKTLREINMKLNPKKYTFRVEEGMFLGYKVNSKGLKVCPDKVDAMLSLLSPKCLKDVQKLNGKLARLNRFLAKSTEKSLPFFKTLKKCTKKSDFHWTTDVEEAFKQMKQLIAELPMLTAPMEKEELIGIIYAFSDSLLLTPLCCDDIHDVTPRVSALAGCDTKDAQAKEIAGLKKRIQKLERKKVIKNYRLKRLRKVGESSRVESSEDTENLDDLHDDELFVDMAVGEKQEKSAKIDEKKVSTGVEDSAALTIPVTTTDEGVTAAKIDEIIPTSAPTTVIDELTLNQTLIEIKAAKPKATKGSIKASQPLKTKDKGKAIMIEPEVPLKRKDQVALDEEMARNLEAQLQAELKEEEKMARKKEKEANITLIESWENT
ncbi:hypothetical protein Tco_1057083 [Tanacetum coccineum]|uniref:Reverse transcriptase domain-containing protein n=1 Tax=Tanacetum coccineum TaxID=301880 RepID=A0ABQ5H4L2_9ASTR